MPTTIILPDGIQYIPLALVSTAVILAGQTVMVSKYRKRAKIAYPQLYADKAQVDASKDALEFNCAQRAHQNTLENIPVIYAATLVNATKFPILAASIMGLWSLCRVSYTYGYISGDPQKRATTLYVLGHIGQLASLALSVYVAGDWVYQGLIPN